MPHCVRVLAFLALSFGFATFGVPASADQPSQQCLSNLFEDLFVMRAQRAGLQVLRFKDAQGTIRIPANDPAAQAGKDRHFDIVVIDSAQPDRPLSIEATIGKVNTPTKRIQLIKDASAIRYGVDLPGLQIAPTKLKVVWGLGYRPNSAMLQQMMQAGIGYYNYLDGESNVMQLNEYFRPTQLVMQTVLTPGPLSQYARQLAEQQIHGDAGLLGALQAIGVMWDIYSDISNALHHKEVGDEIERGLALSIQDIRRQYASNETFLVDITRGSDRAGPFGDLWGMCMPTVTYAHVTEVGRYNCTVGAREELPVMSAEGHYFRSIRVCLNGVATSLPTSSGGYRECEVMQDPDCPPRQPSAGSAGGAAPAGAASGGATPAGPTTPPGNPVPAARPATAISVEPNIARAGGDYGQFEMDQPNYETCRSACWLDSRCAAYTYVIPGLQGPKARCWLKSVVTQPYQNGCCASGVKQ